MPLNRMSLKIAVFLALLAAVTLKIFNLNFSIAILTPCCVISLYRLPRLQASFFCLGIGFFVDTLSLAKTAGLYAVSFAFAGYLLHSLTYYFFSDKLSTLPLMTVIFSSLISALTGLYQSLSHVLFHHTLEWIKYDLILYPLLDGIMVFIAVHGVIFLWKKVQRTLFAYE